VPDESGTATSGRPVYQEIADRYAAEVDTRPINAFYERPAVLSLQRLPRREQRGSLPRCPIVVCCRVR